MKDTDVPEPGPQCLEVNIRVRVDLRDALDGRRRAAAHVAVGVGGAPLELDQARQLIRIVLPALQRHADDAPPIEEEEADEEIDVAGFVAFRRDDLYLVERQLVGYVDGEVMLRPESVVVVASTEGVAFAREVLQQAGVRELPVCVACGCTRDKPCDTPEGPCAWATVTMDRCTVCVREPPR